MTEVLTYSLADGIVTVTLNRPEAWNAASAELHTAVSTVWDELAALEGAEAVVITGAGKAFSAGGDLNLLQTMTTDLDLRRQMIDEGRQLVRSMATFPLPVVAAVNGPAVGLGCSLASLADLVVMADDAYFSDPHVMLGLVAGDGGALTWPVNMGLQRTKEWLLLGGRIEAAKALEWGLANRVVPKADVVTEATALARQLADLPPQAVRVTRQVLNHELLQRIDANLELLLEAEFASFDEPAMQANLKRMLARQK